MKHLKYLAGSSLLSLACIGLFIACGDDVGTDSCVLDTDCVAPEVCEGEICVPTCTTNEDCGIGEECTPRVNGTGSVCTVASANTNNSTTDCSAQEDPNAFCEAQAGAGAFCDTASGECVGDNNGGTDPVYAIQISDVTTVSDACEGSSDPGSDIQGVELQDSTGNSLAWGNLIANGVETDGNTQLNFGVVEGEPPSLDGSGCVESFDGNVLALGCLGYIGVEFNDDMGNPIALEEGQTIFVYEYGGVCSTGTTDDEFTVYTCDDYNAVSGGDVGSCTNTLGTGSGVASFGVTFQ